MKKNIFLYIPLFIVGLCSSSYGVEPLRSSDDPDWGIGVVVRTATVPYVGNNDSVSSFVPLFFYDGERFFLDGFGGGIKLYDNEKYRVDLFTQLRFVDIPRDYQNMVQADTFDFGVRFTASPFESLEAQLELLSDDHGRFHSNIGTKYIFGGEKYSIAPYVNFHLTGGDYNDYYYGLDRESIGTSTELSIGIEGRYHLWNNWYAIGKIENTFLGDGIRSSSYVDEDMVQEFTLGVAYLNNPENKKGRELTNKPYIRLAHGWGTTSNIGDIIAGDTKKDPYNNQLTSIFYGHPLSDEFMGLPIDIYLTPGLVWHHSSDVQSTITEAVIAIKAYYTFTWPFEWRFGVAEGLSYVSDITYVEDIEMQRKDFESSNLMNYLDFSVDVHLGNLFRSDSLENWFLGYSIHHRSAIFESASQFGRISGGSNYNTVYLQYHF